MKKCARKLQAIVYSAIGLSLLMIILFETDILAPGSCGGNMTAEFYTLMAAELITICVVPLALWMFRAKTIKQKLISGKEHSLLRFGILRLSLLIVPMVANTLLYYMFMLPSFGYMAIILFLSIFFVFPSMERCVSRIVIPYVGFS